MRYFLLIILGCLGAFTHAADSPFLKKDDVVAFVGGETMVELSEQGYLEYLLLRALPDLGLKFRSVTWEGDTVYEQNRDEGYPGLENQLTKAKATVVVAQFGQMECLDGKEKLPAFIAAYDSLVNRLIGDSKRRVVLLLPLPFTKATAGFPDLTAREADELYYAEAIEQLGKKRGCLVIDAAMLIAKVHRFIETRDGIHPTQAGHFALAQAIVSPLGGAQASAATAKGALEPACAVIRKKNLLWFHYLRPQNWAFLGGNRIEQPSSHDHKNPAVRWFPIEMEEFVPLIAAKEQEINELMAKSK